MCSVLIPLLAVWGICHARPVQDASVSLDSINPSMWFPLGYFPILENASGSLGLPIRPETSQHLIVEPRFDGRRGISFKRGLLVMSLAVEAYWEWKNDDTRPIARPTIRRALVPFQDFVYREVPSGIQGTSMNPLALGITYCSVLSYVSTQDITSGALTASITHRAARGIEALVGRVEIFNQPQQLYPKSSRSPALIKNLEETFWENTTLSHVLQPGNHSILQAGNQQNASLQITPDEMELRWFGCMREFLFYVFGEPRTDLVTDKLPTPSPGAKSYRIYRQKGDQRVEDYLEILIFPAAATLELRFQELMEEVLIWGAGVTLGEPYSTGGIILRERVNMAYVRIIINGKVPGGGVPGGAANIATA